MSRTPKFKVYGVSTLRTLNKLEIDVSFRIDLESAAQRLSKEQISAVLAGVAKVVSASKGLNFDVVGFDIERHDYGTGGYPGQLVIQDALTLHGSQFKDAAVIVASPPCQAYSYRAMPWKKAKALPPPDNTLFEACFRIRCEASEAAGRHIPLIVENVKGAQPWVGRARWHFGSYYLWGDVPALMPIARAVKVSGQNWRETHKAGKVSPHWSMEGLKLPEGNCSPRRWDERGIQRLCDATKGNGSWFGNYQEAKQAGRGSANRYTSSNSLARKAASAQIAKIPFPLARHIAKCFYPAEQRPLHREAQP